MIDLKSATFIGPEIRDTAVLNSVPSDLRCLLGIANGFIVFDGGLHVRGLCDQPIWHSLQNVWTGDDALAALYPALREDDIPFAQDFLGDQFILRDGTVRQLESETGELTDLDIDLGTFLHRAAEAPDEYLSLGLLRQWQSDDGVWQPGHLLSVYPPLCTKEAADGVNLGSIPAREHIRFLADFAQQIAKLQEGTRFRIKVT